MIRKRLTRSRNQNYVAFWAGQTRSGKTTSAVAFAMEVDPNFGPENVVWKVDDFMNVLSSGKFANGKKLVPGSVIIFDEFASEVGSRDWYSVFNKVCMKVLQTFGYLNICVIFTGPSLSLADSKTKILLHGYFQTDSNIIYQMNLVKVRVYQVIHNSMTNKTWMRNYHAVIDGERFKIPFMLIGDPPASIMEQIDKQTNERKEDILTESEGKVNHHLEDIKSAMVKKKAFDPTPFGNKILMDPDKWKYCTRKNPENYSKEVIGAYFNLSSSQARIVKGYIEMKLVTEPHKTP